MMLYLTYKRVVRSVTEKKSYCIALVMEGNTGVRKEATAEHERNGSNEEVCGEHGRPESSRRDATPVGCFYGTRCQQVNHHARHLITLSTHLLYHPFQLTPHALLHRRFYRKEIWALLLLLLAHSIGQAHPLHPLLLLTVNLAVNRVGKDNERVKSLGQEGPA